MKPLNIVKNTLYYAIIERSVVFRKYKAAWIIRILMIPNGLLLCTNGDNH